MRPLLIFIFALFSLGFIVETPETIREAKLQEKQWHKAVSKQYDLTALRLFLAEQIRAYPTVDSVSLAKSKLERKWSHAGTALSCGNWLFYVDSPESNNFRISWTYESINKNDGTILERNVTFAGERQSKSTFKLIKVKRTDDECIVLIP